MALEIRDPIYTFLRGFYNKSYYFLCWSKFYIFCDFCRIISNEYLRIFIFCCDCVYAVNVNVNN